jgi:hypothetical protein
MHHLNTPNQVKVHIGQMQSIPFFTNDQDYAITLHLVFTASIPYGKYRPPLCISVQMAMFALFSFLSADDCRRAQFVPL